MPTNYESNSRISGEAVDSPFNSDVQDSRIVMEKDFGIVDIFKTLKFTSINLENKGSVARDHMANERTFLAWLRTSLGFISIGIGITQLARLEKKQSSIHVLYSTIDLAEGTGESSIIKLGKPLGILFIIVGIFTLILGTVRFFKVQAMLTRNYFPASKFSILCLVSIIFIIISITFGMVITTTK